jgi:DNA-binding MarR family transcriptional regulator
MVNVPLTIHWSGTNAMSVVATPLVEQILGELSPWIHRRQRALARDWCLRSVSMTHLHVLLLLQTEGTLSMSRLAELLDVSLPNATGIVGRMEERRLVQRVHDDHDRRIVQVQLSPGGMAVLEETDLMRREQLARILEELTPEQQQTCLRAVRDLRAAAERLAARDELDRALPTP